MRAKSPRAHTSTAALARFAPAIETLRKSMGVTTTEDDALIGLLLFAESASFMQDYKVKGGFADAAPGGADQPFRAQPKATKTIAKPAAKPASKPASKPAPPEATRPCKSPAKARPTSSPARSRPEGGKKAK